MEIATIRSIPRWLAGIVQELELEQAVVVTVDDVQRVLRLSRPVVRRAIHELVCRGWLRPIGLKGTYEFIPGAAAGPFPSGDPWLFLRAELGRYPGRFHVGATSAAWLLGYAQRSPSRHIVITTPDVRVPVRMKDAYEVLATHPAPASTVINGLPVPTPTELFVEVAQLAPRLNLDAAQGWLSRLLKDTTPHDIAALLRGRSLSTRARAGYLAEICGADEAAESIAALGSLGRGPFYTGHQSATGTFSSRWRVYDSGRVAPPTSESAQ